MVQFSKNQLSKELSIKRFIANTISSPLIANKEAHQSTHREQTIKRYIYFKYYPTIQYLLRAFSEKVFYCGVIAQVFLKKVYKVIANVVYKKVFDDGRFTSVDLCKSIRHYVFAWSKLSKKNSPSFIRFFRKVFAIELFVPLFLKKISLKSKYGPFHTKQPPLLYR